MSAPTILLISWISAAVAFALCFLWARRINNYGVVDVAWSAGFTGVVGLAAWLGRAPIERKALLVAVVALWSLRLAWHLGVRVARHHPKEDGRYQQLRRDWAGNFSVKMAGFFQAQALIFVLLSWPFIAVANDSAHTFHLNEWVGVAIALIAIMGEATADVQLKRFKAETPDSARVCDVGLWRYSRHPNYFFEWLIWVGFAVLAWSAPAGWLSVACPVFMFYLLMWVTGIRYTEAQLERSKGDAYRAYRRRTSAFFPWFPRKTPSAL